MGVRCLVGIGHWSLLNYLITSMKYLAYLKGKRTYIVAVLVGVLSVLQYLGVLSSDVYVTLMGVLGAGGLASLRAGVNR